MFSGSDTDNPSRTQAQACIELENISLRFRMYGDQAPTFKHAMLNKLLRRKYNPNEEFQLFDGLKLSIANGERVGIIGPNGAGKSTLLKVITGIYVPLTGTVKVNGKITPLIDISIGMNNELSGVENIMLMGAIIGLSASHMAKKVDSILDFAGVRHFSQTPMKYYSTGMRMRLALSVATHTEPQILLGDEVFAGGDAQFVKKVSARMKEMMGNSKIVVFVSHSMPLLQELTTRTIWLEKGEIAADGPTDEIIRQYQDANS